MKKHRITKLKLNEISGVDKPAQPGATLCIAKRAPTTPNDDVPGPQETAMFKTRAELLAAIAKFNTDGGTLAEMTNIVKSATALSAVADLPAELAPLAKADDTTPDPAVTALKEQVEELTKKAGMSDKERELYEKMSPEDKKKHLKKSDAERTEAVEKAFATDPVVYTTLDGVDITKSAGAVTLALAKKLDDQTRALAKSEAKAADQEITKRAETELGSLGGDLEARKDLLKAVDTISDEKRREEVLKSLRSADAAVAKAFQKVGTKDGKVSKAAGGGDPEEQLEELAKAYATTHKVDFTKAYAAVIETDEGKELYTASLEA